MGEPRPIEREGRGGKTAGKRGDSWLTEIPNSPRKMALTHGDLSPIYAPRKSAFMSRQPSVVLTLVASVWNSIWPAARRNGPTSGEGSASCRSANGSAWR